MVFPSFSMHFGEKLSILRTKELSRPSSGKVSFPHHRYENLIGVSPHRTLFSLFDLAFLFCFVCMARIVDQMNCLKGSQQQRIIGSSVVLPRNHRDEPKKERILLIK